MVKAAAQQLAGAQVAAGQVAEAQEAQGSVTLQLANGLVATGQVSNGTVNMQLANGQVVDLALLEAGAPPARQQPSAAAGASAAGEFVASQGFVLSAADKLPAEQLWLATCVGCSWAGL
jgi:hypothetical protein